MSPLWSGQIYWDSKILLDCLLQERPLCYKVTLSLHKGWPYKKGTTLYKYFITTVLQCKWMGNSEIQNEHDSWSNAYLLHNQFYGEKFIRNLISYSTYFIVIKLTLMYLQNAFLNYVTITFYFLDLRRHRRNHTIDFIRRNFTMVRFELKISNET